MRIVVMGTGGMGGFYGGRLALTGQDVTFIARGAHLDVMQRDGLLLTGPDGDQRIEPTKATDNPQSIGQTADVVLFCVKLYDAEAAAELVKPVVGDETLIVSLMNGVDGPARIADIIGRGHVLGGAAYDSATIKGPGIVEYRRGPNRLVLGPLDGQLPDAAQTFAEAGRAAGFDMQVSDDIARVLWEKFVLLSTNAGLTSLTRQPVGVVYGDPETRALAVDMMKEVISIAKAEGVTVGDDVIERSMGTLDTFPPDMFASAYFDLAAGKRMEVGSFSGLIAALGEKHGIPVPHHRTVWACLKPYVHGIGS